MAASIIFINSHYYLNNYLKGLDNTAKGSILARQIGVTNYALTQDIYKLTNSDQDKTYPIGTDTAHLTDTFLVSLAAPASGAAVKQQMVGHADKDHGKGANVFVWASEDIQLMMRTDAAVANAIYKTSLTWTNR